MLTGDKIETAMCISISAGLKSKHHKFFTISDDFTTKNVFELLNKYSIDPEGHILIIDGQCLETALRDFEKLFFEVTLKVRIRLIYRHLLLFVVAVHLLKSLKLLER